MHRYSISTSAATDRERVTKIITSAALVWAIIWTISINTVRQVAFTYFQLQDSANIIYDVLMGVIPIGVYGILASLYNNILWKHLPFQWWNKLPDFNGQWEGEIRSPAKKNGKSKITVWIKQNWDRISIKTQTEQGRKAVGRFAEVQVTEEGDCFLNYAFYNMRRTGSYMGANFLEYDEESGILNGEYFTSKTMPLRIHGYIEDLETGQCHKKKKFIKEALGSKGRIEVKRIKRDEKDVIRDFVLYCLALVAIVVIYLAPPLAAYFVTK